MILTHDNIVNLHQLDFGFSQGFQQFFNEQIQIQLLIEIYALVGRCTIS